MTTTSLVFKTSTKRNIHNSVTDGGAIAATMAEIQKDVRDTRICDLTAQQNLLFDDACSELFKTQQNIQDLIEINRGGDSGIHGFIAEQLETGIGNAKSIMNGEGIRFVLLDDNGRDDLLIDACPVQMKFVQKALSLDAVRDHMEKYPEAIANGEIYMIPKDFWEKLHNLWKINAEDAGKLRNTEYALWKKLHELNDAGLETDKLCGAEFSYGDAQKDRYANTIDRCQKEVSKQNCDAIKKIVFENGPSLVEALKTICIGAGIEGTLSGIVLIVEKYQMGVKVSDYTKEDTLEVVKTVGKGTLNGGLRSGLVYLAVNFTPIPAGVASGLYTIAEKTIKTCVDTKTDQISSEKSKEEIISTIVDVVVTTALSMVGAKCYKKNKALGAVIGTAAAKVLLFSGKKVYSYFASQKNDSEAA